MKDFIVTGTAEFQGHSIAVNCTIRTDIIGEADNFTIQKIFVNEPQRYSPAAQQLMLDFIDLNFKILSYSRLAIIDWAETVDLTLKIRESNGDGGSDTLNIEDTSGSVSVV